MVVCKSRSFYVTGLTPLPLAETWRARLAFSGQTLVEVDSNGVSPRYTQYGYHNQIKREMLDNFWVHYMLPTTDLPTS